ncbi:hypothetical protein BDR05DRAFT_521170 [Suillus weaverae]|nr:hypothetical protein BDR05DRAFT_521170 [Suillus weaverae]
MCYSRLTCFQLVQIPPTVLHCTTSAAPDSSRHILVVSEDGVLHPVIPSPAEHCEGGTEFGLISSAMDRSSNQEDINPDPPGSRIANRVTSLRMRTAAVWASIPATVEGLPASCASSKTSTPAKSQINSLGHDETTTVTSVTVDSPSFSSPATSITAVSDWGPRDSLANLSMIGHKQDWIREMPKVCITFLVSYRGLWYCEGLTCVGCYLPRPAARAGFVTY